MASGNTEKGSLRSPAPGKGQAAAPGRGGSGRGRSQGPRGRAAGSWPGRQHRRGRGRKAASSEQCFLERVLASGAGQGTRGKSNNLVLHPLQTKDASPVQVAMTGRHNIPKCTVPDEDNSLEASRNQPVPAKTSCTLSPPPHKRHPPSATPDLVLEELPSPPPRGHPSVDVLLWVHD